MQFPSLFLNKRNRHDFSEDRIMDSHYMYARHKPGHDWNIKDGLPDFSKIKIDDHQSFNWCIFSIPIWTRFNDEKVYHPNYAVVGFSVDTVRNTFQYDDNFQDNTLGFEHKSLEHNYSHCQLKMNVPLDKVQRREIRLVLKNKSIVPLKPDQEQNYFGLLKDVIKMFYYRIFLRLVSIYHKYYNQRFPSHKIKKFINNAKNRVN